MRWNSGTSPSGAYQVKTPDAIIRPLGTTFDLLVESQRTMVVLRSGTIEVCSVGAPQRCRTLSRPGEMIVATPSDLEGPQRGGLGPSEFADRCLSADAAMPCLAATCPPDSVGTPPNCNCRPPLIGTPGSCRLEACPQDSVGKPPNCRCRPPLIGTPGRCTRLIECRPGHHRVGRTCVPDIIECRPGWHRVGGQCVPDVRERICPPGQHRVGSRCVPSRPLPGPSQPNLRLRPS